jgi:hypothetical protein
LQLPLRPRQKLGETRQDFCVSADHPVILFIFTIVMRTLNSFVDFTPILGFIAPYPWSIYELRP